MPDVDKASGTRTVASSSTWRLFVPLVHWKREPAVQSSHIGARWNM